MDRVGGEYTKAAREWRLEGWGIGAGLHEQRRQLADSEGTAIPQRLND